MNKKAIMICGGTLEEDFILETLERNQNSGNLIIGVDKGAEFLFRHGVMPRYVVGDFDSAESETIDYYRGCRSVLVKEYSADKDASDTELAIGIALDAGAREIMILGATGGRVDHMLANIQVLFLAYQAGVNACILDAQNRIRLIGRKFELKKDEAYGAYFSILPLGDCLCGLSITGAKYNLKQSLLPSGSSLGISNRIVQEKVVIEMTSGTGIFIESKDRRESEGQIKS